MRSLRMPALSMPGNLPRRWIAAAFAIVLIIAAVLWWQGRVQAHARDQKFDGLVSQSESKRSLG